jgi:hypothetical protein
MQFMVVSVLQFFNSPSAVKLLSYNFICMYKLVYLSGKFIVLARNNMDVVVHGVYFLLHVGVVLMQGLV